MKQLISITILVNLLLSFSSCKQGQQQKENTSKQETKTEVNTTLYDKSLSEIKQLINGKWELVKSKNVSEENEFENTFILFDNDRYVWTEDGESEEGKMNWRKTDTGNGYESYLMDVFYEEYPSYPLAIKGNTLTIQDCSETAYKYTLVRVKE